MFYAKFIGWDMQMVEPGEEPAVANNSSISEDLGQIEFVLSDKTGTLTQNSMVFQKATVDGVIFTVDDINDDKESKFKSFTSAVKNASLDSDKAVLDLVLNMVLNNGVQPTKKDDGKVVFRSASPDEEALVQACADVGVVLLSREGPTVEINVKGQKKKFMQLQELEFTSNRKRMSVVTRDLESGVLYLYVKGADDVIYERLRSDQDTVQLRRDLDDFAREGLRTLVYGYRVLSDEDYTKWFEIYQKAKTELVDREVAVEKACELLERDFYLTGATAIEDKLQVDVADTISVTFRYLFSFPSNFFIVITRSWYSILDAHWGQV
jgi:phospholipid-translocating ATPase